VIISPKGEKVKIFVTGGAGFIGSNVAAFHLKRGDQVFVLDDLSRKGSRANLDWLNTLGRFVFFQEDIREKDQLKESLKACGEIDIVYHFAAQVAVTTSVSDPANDFSVNAVGSFNLLEAVRQMDIDPVIIYSSTNKVYGKMKNVSVCEKEGRYAYESLPLGIGEDAPLDFYSPYGCSKGCADQYFMDYSRIYGMKTVVFRQSCIYGPRQFGVEDQGWVAWFTIAAQQGRPVTIYGDGKQVRDILDVQDLIELYLKAYENIEQVKGKAFNAGGGPDNTLSLLELISALEKRTGKRLELSFSDWRPGDQKIYVSDITRLKDDLEWVPSIGKEEGIDRLYKWVSVNSALFGGQEPGGRS
jgi:CDP-paratose 2-epimerase